MQINWAHILTLGNLFCGIFAIGIADPVISCLFILAGAILDLFDGLVARMLKMEGEVGAHLDSLADLITFGVAPAILYLEIRPDMVDFPLALTAVAFLGAGTAYRLALFNTLPSISVFRGLPSPASGLFFAGWVFSISYGGEYIPDLYQNEFLYLALPLLFTALMNIRAPFFSAKNYTRELPQGLPHYLLMAGTLLLFLLIPIDAAALSISWYILLSLVFFPFVRNNKSN